MFVQIDQESIIKIKECFVFFTWWVCGINCSHVCHHKHYQHDEKLSSMMEMEGIRSYPHVKRERCSWGRGIGVCNRSSLKSFLWSRFRKVTLPIYLEMGSEESQVKTAVDHLGKQLVLPYICLLLPLLFFPIPCPSFLPCQLKLPNIFINVSLQLSQPLKHMLLIWFLERELNTFCV